MSSILLKRPEWVKRLVIEKACKCTVTVDEAKSENQLITELLHFLPTENYDVLVEAIPPSVHFTSRPAQIIQMLSRQPSGTFECELSDGRHFIKAVFSSDSIQDHRDPTTVVYSLINLQHFRLVLARAHSTKAMSIKLFVTKAQMVSTDIRTILGNLSYINEQDGIEDVLFSSFEKFDAKTSKSLTRTMKIVFVGLMIDETTNSGFSLLVGNFTQTQADISAVLPDTNTSVKVVDNEDAKKMDDFANYLYNDILKDAEMSEKVGSNVLSNIGYANLQDLIPEPPLNDQPSSAIDQMMEFDIPRLDDIFADQELNVESLSGKQISGGFNLSADLSRIEDNLINSSAFAFPQQQQPPQIAQNQNYSGSETPAGGKKRQRQKRQAASTPRKRVKATTGNGESLLTPTNNSKMLKQRANTSPQKRQKNPLDIEMELDNSREAILAKYTPLRDEAEFLMFLKNCHLPHTTPTQPKTLSVSFESMVAETPLKQSPIARVETDERESDHDNDEEESMVIIPLVTNSSFSQHKSINNKANGNDDKIFDVLKRRFNGSKMKLKQVYKKYVEISRELPVVSFPFEACL